MKRPVVTNDVLQHILSSLEHFNGRACKLRPILDRKLLTRITTPQGSEYGASATGTSLRTDGFTEKCVICTKSFHHCQNCVSPTQMDRFLILTIQSSLANRTIRTDTENVCSVETNSLQVGSILIKKERSAERIHKKWNAQTQQIPTFEVWTVWCARMVHIPVRRATGTDCAVYATYAPVWIVPIRIYYRL